MNDRFLRFFPVWRVSAAELYGQSGGQSWERARLFLMIPNKRC